MPEKSKPALVVNIIFVVALAIGLLAILLAKMIVSTIHDRLMLLRQSIGTGTYLKGQFLPLLLVLALTAVSIMIALMLTYLIPAEALDSLGGAM